MNHHALALLLALTLLAPRFAEARETAATPDSSNIVRTIAVQDDYLWCATPSGVVRWDTGNLTAVRYTSRDGLGVENIFAVAAYYDGSALAGAGRLVYKFDPLAGSWAEISSDNGLSGNVTSLLIHPECMYCASTDQGVCRYANNSWGRYTTADGLADNLVRQLAEAPDGTVWFATAGGVSHYNLDLWKLYTVADGLASNDARAVAVDADATVWIGTAAGVSRFNGTAWKNFTREDGLGDPDIRAIAAAPDRSVWAGTSSGMYRFTGLIWEKSKTPGAPSEPVRAVAVDASGTVWAGTDRGLYKYDGLEWTLLQPASVPVAVEETASLPTRLSILGNFPNPFNPETIIEFELPRKSVATIAVYSITGHRVRTLVSGPMSPGAHTLCWDGRDGSGRAISLK